MKAVNEQHLRHGTVAGIVTDFVRKRSLRFIIAFACAFVTMLVAAFVGLSINARYARAVEKDVAVSTGQIVDQVERNLEAYLASMMETSEILKANIDRYRVLDRGHLITLMETVLSVRSDIVSASIFTFDGQLIATVPTLPLKQGLDFASQDWFSSVTVGAPGSPSTMHFQLPHVQNLFRQSYPWVVSLSRPVSWIENNQVVDGVLLVDMNFGGIDELCRSVSLGSRGFVYVMGAEGTLVYHPQQQAIYLDLKRENNLSTADMPDGTFFETFEGERRLVNVKTLPHAGWRIVGVSFMDDLMTSRTEVGNYAIVIMLLGIVLALFLSVLLSAQIVRPVQNLARLMGRAEAGDFTVEARIEGEREVRNLSHAFNIMIARIRALMDQIVVEQEQKRRSEFKALQAQINPHFLYNTLDSIVWMAENGRNEEVVRMTEALARLFRIGISRGEEFIPLEMELDHARSYLTIQKIRYKDKFDFTLHLDPDVATIPVPKIILQPLIENAIYHGVRNSVDPGTIRVTAQRVPQGVRISVSDNGSGMHPAKAAELLSESHSISHQTRETGTAREKSSRGSGVGLKNVHDRLRLHYGPEYGLTVESELDEGTTVTIQLPLPGQPQPATESEGMP